MRKKRGPYRMPRPPVTQPSDPSYKIIALTQGQNTMVTAADFPYLDQFNWYARWSPKNHCFYAVRKEKINGCFCMIQMAREILQCRPEEQADHKNRNSLDNRRNNLRKATNTQNCSNRGVRSSNTSGYIGVNWHKHQIKWIARIQKNGKRIFLGYFDSAEEAARARDEAAKKYHGEFAVLNFPIT